MLEKQPKELLTILDKEIYEDEDIAAIFKLTHELGGIESARNLAKKYTDKAYKLIGQLPDNEYKSMLKEMSRVLLERAY